MPKRQQETPSTDPQHQAGTQEEAVPEPKPPVQVFYCEGTNRRIWLLTPADCDRIVCTFPLEYCEFGSHFTKCKEWLKEEHPDLFDRYYSDG